MIDLIVSAALCGKYACNCLINFSQYLSEDIETMYRNKYDICLRIGVYVGHLYLLSFSDGKELCQRCGGNLHLKDKTLAVGK